METPQEIQRHNARFEANAWKQYTLMELGAWVSLLHKRAGHRAEVGKAWKDLEDARNYLAMMTAHLDDLQANLKPKPTET